MKENTAQIVAQVPVDVAAFLLNEKRAEVLTVETRFKVNVLLVPNRHLETPNYSVQRMRHDELNQGEAAAGVVPDGRAAGRHRRLRAQGRSEGAAPGSGRQGHHAVAARTGQRSARAGCRRCQRRGASGAHLAFADAALVPHAARRRRATRHRPAAEPARERAREARPPAQPRRRTRRSAARGDGRRDAHPRRDERRPERERREARDASEASRRTEAQGAIETPRRPPRKEGERRDGRREPREGKAQPTPRPPRDAARSEAKDATRPRAAGATRGCAHRARRSSRTRRCRHRDVGAGRFGPRGRRWQWCRRASRRGCAASPRAAAAAAVIAPRVASVHRAGRRLKRPGRASACRHGRAVQRNRGARVGIDATHRRR